ncbi:MULTISPECIES: hypothetical protein [Streptomyces]|uniref:hypothetical protein n=1 Tax=Streptomyces TaxID=1883 RepID=UPI000B1BDEF6|nr:MULTISPECIES: hypothetical protein [unclassified Streptomyces]RPK71193.1 hypothetical protein EES45_34995 [Streptomyces sp. ADI97-07]
MNIEAMRGAGGMLEIAIPGSLAEGPLPGHELRRHVTALTGYSRPDSDGTLYPEPGVVTYRDDEEYHAAHP